ncbi:hypothetical protein DXG01_015679, partial [Tephrocybe rancida]
MGWVDERDEVGMSEEETDDDHALSDEEEEGERRSALLPLSLLKRLRLDCAGQQRTYCTAPGAWHKAIQLIADSPNPLATLKQLSQNFPKYASALARRVVINSSLDEELQANGMKAQGVYHDIPSVKYNIFNVLDLSQTNCLAFIVDGQPHRLEYTLDSASYQSPKRKILTEAQPMDKPTVDWDLGSETHEVADLDDILSGKASPSAPLDKVKTYVERLGATLSACSTGQHFDYNETHSGKITDEQEGLSDTLATYFYDQLTTSLRRNRYMHPTDAPGSMRVLNLVNLFARMGFRVAPSAFLHPFITDQYPLLAETTVIPLSIYVVADLDSLEGLKLVIEALLSIALLVNGRVIGPIEGDDFLAADFSALENYEIRKQSEPIITALEMISPLSSLVD